MGLQSRAQRLMKRLNKKASRGYRGFPTASIAFYGPNDQVATKVVVGISPDPDSPADEMHKWHSSGDDIRRDAKTLEEVLACIDAHGALSVVKTPGIFGCPHEEGIDYPEGETCPECPYWADKDRYAIFDES